MKISFTSLVPATDTDKSAKQIIAADDQPFFKKIPADLNCLLRGIVFSANNMAEFAQHLRETNPGSVFIYGVPKANPNSQGYYQIGPEYKVIQNPQPGFVARKNENFVWPTGAGILFLDVDYNDLDVNTVLERLYAAVPELRDYTHVYQPSSSANIKDNEGKVDTGLSGLHIYFAVEAPHNIKTYGENIFARLALLGFANYAVSRAGTFLRRGLVDQAVWQSTRIDYTGGSFIPDGWTQDREPTVVYGTKGDVVPSKVFKPLKRDEKARVEEIYDELNEATKDEQEAQYRVWLSEAKTPQERKAREQFRKTGKMTKDNVIILKDKTEVTVGEIYANPSKYHKARCFDPFEGVNYGLCAMIYHLGEDGIMINSNAHGGAKYYFKSDTWRSDLLYNAKGELKSNSIRNAALFITDYCKRKNYVVQYNEFSATVEFNGKELDDATMIDMREAIEGDFIMSKDVFGDGIIKVANCNKHNPVKKYLEELEWDGEERISTWLKDYANAKDTPALPLISRAFLISMVARVMKPGSKVDTTLLLYGGQGARKSTLAATLCGNPAYFSDNMPAITYAELEAKRHLAGKWIVELAEMNATKKADITAVKNFLTATTDKYRRPYDRLEVSIPRQCVFIATTNEDKPLNDPTGNRRYWPVHIMSKIDIDRIKEERDQLFAEAVVAFMAGEKWYFDEDSDEGKIIAAETENFVEEEPLTDILRRKLEDDIPMVAEITSETLRDLLEINPSNWNKFNKSRAFKAMRSLKEWEEVTVNGYPRWKRKESNVYTANSDSVVSFSRMKKETTKPKTTLGFEDIK